MSNSGGQSSASSSNNLSGLTDALSNAFSGISTGFSNLFTGGGNNFTADPTGMSAADVSNLFSNIGSDAFNEDTATAQATAALTPPAQAQAAAATGQDPAAGVGGSQSQTASTGPAPQQPPSQDQQDQAARTKAVDELRRLLDQRNKNRPWEYPPRQIAAFQASSTGTNPPATPYPEGPSWQREYEGYNSEGESNQAEYGPGRHGPYPEGPDYQTEYGHELNLPGPGPARLPPPGGPTSSGQLVPAGSTAPVAGEEGRQITVRPRAQLPPETVPGTPGAPAGTDAPITFREGDPIPIGGGGGVPGLPGLGWLPWWLEGGAIGAGAVPLSATPAETGEFTPAEPNFVRPDAPVGNRGLPGPKDPPPQPTTVAAPPPPKAKTAPKRADPPRRAPPTRQVWVPPTPGHYVPTTGNARGPATWVPGTPGHFVTVAGQGGPRAAVSASARVPPPRKTAEAAPEPSLADGGPMAYSESGMSPMLRDVLGINLPTMLAALATDERASRPSQMAQTVSFETPAAGGGFRIPGRPVGPLNQPRQAIEAAAQMSPGANYQPTGNRFTDSLVAIESGGRGDAWGDRGRGDARGFTQMQDATWRDFASRAGIDVSRFPRADMVDQATQIRVASTIPFYRWGDRTRRLMHQQFGDFNENLTMGQLSQMLGGGGRPPTQTAQPRPPAQPPMATGGEAQA